MRQILASILVYLLFAPLTTLAAGFTVTQGGIGTTTVPANYVVIGKDALHLTAVSTSSLGLVTSVSNSDGTLTISPTVGAVIASINLAHANIWTALQTFSNASSTLLTVSGTQWITPLGTPAGAFLAVDPNGKIIATTTPSSGSATVTSVTAATPNSTLTLGGTNPITTSGTINFDLNLAHSNFWTALQNFTNASTSMLSATSTVWFTSLATPAGTVLAVDNNGKLIATTTPQGTVTSITAGTGLNGGTITNTGTISLKSYFATSSPDTNGQILYYTSTNGTPALVGSAATGTVSAGTGVSVTAGQSVIGSGLTITNTGVTSLTATAPLSRDTATGAVTISCPTCSTGTFAWPWTIANNFGTSTNSTSTPTWYKLGLYASSTSQFANSSTTQATIGTLWTGLTAFSLLTTDANGQMVASSTISTSFLTGNLGTINTSAPLGGGGAFNKGTTLTLTCATCTTGGITALGNYATTTGTVISFSTSTTAFNGLTFGQTIGVTAGNLQFTPTVTGTLNNTGLANSSVTVNTTAPLGGGGAVSLGGTLTLTCTTCNTFGWPWTIASTFGTSTNATSTGAWFQLGLYASSTSQFNNSSTTLATVGTEWLPSLAVAAGSFLAVDNNGKIIATTTPSGGGGTITGTGVNGMMTAWNSTTNLIATSTIIGGSFIATSTTATSSFAGPVGIGTTYPTAVNTNSKFTLAGTGSQDGIASTTDNTTSSDAIWQTYSDSARSFIGSHGSNQTTTRYGITLGGWSEIGFFNSSASTTNGAIIGINTAKPIVFGTNNLDRGRIDGAGNWGIGTTSPGTLLSVGTPGVNFSTATTTWSTTGGINIKSGCYALNGNCVGGLSTVKKQVFTGGGTYNASTGMVTAMVECVGGGGGGGGVDGNAAFTLAGSGGGSGGYSRALITASQAAGGLIVGIGAGGAGGSDGSHNPSDGGQTTVGSVCVANGGIKGIDANVGLAGAGGAGGAAGTGDIAAAGSGGGTGVYSTGAGTTVAIGSGVGGPSFFGGGAAGVASNGAGNGGGAYGSGGSGAYVNGAGTSGSGGAGSNGVVYITEYTSQ